MIATKHYVKARAMQDVSNFIPLVRAFNEAFEEIVEAGVRGEITEHPVVILFVSKMQSMVRTEFEDFHEAYEEAQLVINSQDAAPVIAVQAAINAMEPDENYLIARAQEQRESDNPEP